MLEPYKGYSAKVEQEAGVFYGHVAGIRDVVTFQGDNREETIRAFHDSVDDYIAFCEEKGKQPQRPS